MYILNVLPNLTAVMQETVCSTEQKISANLSLTLNECMKPMPFTAGTYRKVSIKHINVKFIIKLFDLMRKRLMSNMTCTVYLVHSFVL